MESENSRPQLSNEPGLQLALWVQDIRVEIIGTSK